MKLLNLFRLHPDYNSRVYGLDVFRAVAILFVVMGHGGFLIDKALPGFPYVRLVDGVELFFVLSGFLIGTILIRLYEKNGSLSFPQVSEFWKRRWLRTLPNYYLVLLLNILFVYLGITRGAFDHISWKFFFFLQNFNTYFTDFFWESWSLTVEEWFYVLIPLVILAASRLLKNIITRKQLLLFVIITFILLPLLYRCTIAAEQVDPFWFDVKFRKVVITRLDAIMYGVLFAWMKFYYPLLWRKISLPFFIAGVVLLYYFMHLQHQFPTGLFSKTIYFSLTGLSAAMFLPLADSKKNFKTSFGKYITHISLISYSMYLINLGLVTDVIRTHFEPDSAAGGLTWYLVFWISIILLSTLLYKYFEKPVMDLRDKQYKNKIT